VVPGGRGKDQSFSSKKAPKGREGIRGDLQHWFRLLLCQKASTRPKISIPAGEGEAILEQGGVGDLRPAM